jgi:hypothetical protein
MIVFWVVVVAIGFVNRAVLAFARLLKTHGLYNSPLPPKTWFQRRVLMPATFGYKCATEVWCGTLPPRIQTLTIAAFAVLNVLYSIYGYRITPVNL